MRRFGWLLALAACAGRPTPPTPIAQCPTPVATVCPVTDCSACPPPTPPPAPIPRPPPDWQCHDYVRTTMPDSSYCYANTRGCEESREEIRKERSGKTGPCRPERTAHCFEISSPNLNSHYFLCARTADICDKRRKWLRAHPWDKTDGVSACAEVYNDEYYPANDEPLRPPDEHNRDPTAPLSRPPGT